MRKIKMLTVGVFALGTIMIPSTIASAATHQDNGAKNTIMMRESGGDPNAVNPSTGATGLFQCLPTAHPCPALGDVAGQNVWADDYVLQRYGSWDNALNFWNEHGWY